MTERSNGLGRGSPLAAAFIATFDDWQNLRQSIANSTMPAAELAQYVAENAASLVRSLARNATSSVGAAGASQVADAQYAFVALIDETLLFSDWPGRAAWSDTPLESRMFNSRLAGERVPDAIEQLLREHEPATRDLANVYLMCLTLGFRGRLRGDGGAAQHESLRQGLFSFVYQRDPDRKRVNLALERPSMTTPARQPIRRMLPDGLRLTLAITGMFAALLLVSHLLWRDIAGRVEPSLSHFLAVD